MSILSSTKQYILPFHTSPPTRSYYEDGAFGIRIENLFAVVEANTEFR